MKQKQERMHSLLHTSGYTPYNNRDSLQLAESCRMRHIKAPV